MSKLIIDRDEKFTSYNVKNFVDGKTNILLITGFSGSGKSTLAERFAYKFEMTHIELDNIDPKYDYIYEQKYSDKYEVFYDFLDKYPNLDEKIKTRDSWKYREELFDLFFPFCFEWCKKHKDTKYIIEGTQIYEFPKTIDKNLPIIIMNTSAEESADRKYKRDLTYNKNITSKENIDKLYKFSKMISENKEGEASMLNIEDSKIEYKIVPLDNDTYYKFKSSKNRLGQCKFDENYKGLAITANGRTLMGYIIMRNNKMTSIEVLPEYKNQNLLSKLIRFAIDKYGLNEITVPSDRTKFINLIENIGFKKVTKLNGKFIYKLPSVIVRKNDYMGMVVKRENGIDMTSNEEEYIYYFSFKTDSVQDQVGRVALIPSKQYIANIELYDKYNSYKYFKTLLDFATIEKECTTIRVLFGNKEKIAMLEKYGFKTVKKVKNANGKFYVMEVTEKNQFETDEELAEWMQDNIISSEFTKLMTPLEVEQQLTGSSHDQAQFIMEKLPSKYNANSILVLEKNQAGKIVKANTIVYYTKGGKLYWLENCMEKAIGINGPFDNLDDLEEEVSKKFDYINKNKDELDFIPIYVYFNSSVGLEDYINSIITLEEK